MGNSSEGGPGPQPRPFECDICHTIIGHVERRGGYEWLITPFAELQGMGKARCPVCGKLRAWHKRPVRKLTIEEVLLPCGKSGSGSPAS